MGIFTHPHALTVVLTVFRFFLTKICVLFGTWLDWVCSNDATPTKHNKQWIQ